MVARPRSRSRRRLPLLELPAELQARVEDIQNSCCVQNGINVCTEGVPWTCDAQCAVPFMT